MKINENDKITLTIGQLKRLVSESKKRITLWDVFTDNLDGVNKTCQSLYNIVDACKEDNSNYQKQHRKTVEWLGKYVGAEFGPKEALNVRRHFVGLFVDPNDWPPCLMFDNEKAADTVACTLAQGTHLFPEDLYSKQTEWDDDVEESQVNEWEEYVDDDGYSHDDEGNVEYVGRGWASGTYGLHDGPHGSGYYRSRYPVRMKKDVPCWGYSSINLKEAPDGNCPHCGEKLIPFIGRDTTYKKRVSVGHCEKCGVNYKIPEDINTAIQNASPDLCPDCGAKLVKREGKYGEFYSCPRYPDCEFHCSKAKFDKAQRTGKLIGL